MIEIDGSRKSGSGTIVRDAVSLAALAVQDLHLTNIRAKRLPKPGLRAQHLRGIEAIAELCRGRLEGAVIRGREIRQQGEKEHPTLTIQQDCASGNGSRIDFKAIRIDLPRESIYRRLGYRQGATRISPRQTGEIEAYMEEARSLIALQGTVLSLPIRELSPSHVVLGEEVVFESRRLARFLDRCGEAALMGTTAGSAIMTAIDEDAAGRNVTRAVVMDATASEMTDAALDWIMSYLHRLLRRENKMPLSRRYSAGYGDFALENQRTIYRLLQLERFGVTLTESCLLVPEKSVTALTGILNAAP